MQDERYVPAAGRAGLTRCYDRAMAITMRERRWRPQLTAAALHDLAVGGTVVDVGCGTGTQAIAVARERPDAHVIGIDGDGEALAIAAAKPGSELVEWVGGTADDLPLADAAADRVLVSLLLHHLSPAAKAAALTECRRVLAPGGRLHVVDWGRPRGPLTAAGFLALRLLDGWANTAAHAAGQLEDVVAGTGFIDVRARQALPTAFGTLEHLEARPAERRAP